VTIRVLHVVRRFGLVGGMESYVWHLAHALVNREVSVEILCQSVEGTVDPRIIVHRVPPSPHRRRWRAMSDFRKKAQDFWRGFANKESTVVHSHERTSFHHITTFHGPPMPILHELPWYKRMSPRMRAWCRWEEEEVAGPSVMMVAPVSKRIGRMLIERHPKAGVLIGAPFYPGLNDCQMSDFQPVTHGLKLIFVGVEWKRKGLEKATNVAVLLRKYYPNLTLDIFGPPKESVSFLRQHSWIKCHGWVSQPPYSRYHLLIHPAIDEPFGMAVMEALASGCRAIVSECVGAGEIAHRAMRVVDLERDVDEWASEAHNLISEELGVDHHETSFPTWGGLAESYVAAYRQILDSGNENRSND
jgi:UDP-glucose:(heptosyl)LPS alpha-1,3-glucosyltransferase